MNKKIIAASCVVIICLIMCVSVGAVSPEDEEFIVRSVAAEYPELSLAARVGVIEVILNRTASGSYPNTAAGVISAYRNSGGSLRFSERGVMNVEARDLRSYKMTSDAYRLASDGVDITGGALNFEIIDKVDRRYDLDFDDSAEDDAKREMTRISAKYKVVIDGVGFW